MGVSSPSLLGAAQLILPGRPNVISAQVENVLRRSGLPYQNRFEAESRSLCPELTRRGLGYMVLPYSALHHQLEIGGDLSAAPIRTLSVTWQLHDNRARFWRAVFREPCGIRGAALAGGVCLITAIVLWRRLGSMDGAFEPRR